MTEIEWLTEEEWHQRRIGKATSSRLSDVIATAKAGGYRATRANYRAELVVERMTRLPYPSYVSPEMRRGLELEPDARAAYEFETNEEILHKGYCFLDHPTIAMCGSSYDGFLGKRGTFEVKSPNSATHITTLRSEQIDPGYIAQMQWGLACSRRDWCDWCSFDPRMPSGMQLFIKRVHRDDGLIERLADEVIKFLAEVDAEVADLEQRYGRALAA
jgi:predicted phage-related endonuclease